MMIHSELGLEYDLITNSFVNYPIPSVMPILSFHNTVMSNTRKPAKKIRNWSLLSSIGQHSSSNPMVFSVRVDSKTFFSSLTSKHKFSSSCFVDLLQKLQLPVKACELASRRVPRLVLQGHQSQIRLNDHSESLASPLFACYLGWPFGDQFD